jgi:hypothetical protein
MREETPRSEDALYRVVPFGSTSLSDRDLEALLRLVYVGGGFSARARLRTRHLTFFQLRDGLIGLGTKSPPQLGQTLSRTVSTHVAQNVHS